MTDDDRQEITDEIRDSIRENEMFREVSDIVVDFDDGQVMHFLSMLTCAMESGADLGERNEVELIVLLEEALDRRLIIQH